MNAAEATTFIETRLRPDDDPTLTEAEVTSLLPLAAAIDVNDIEPGEDDWIPTYSTVGCYRAIAEGWSLKYGRIIGRFDFTTDGQQFQRSQMLDHIEHQRKTWARKVQQDPSTLSST
jgi:hypothetical protein